jgi:hypothetical protein
MTDTFIDKMLQVDLEDLIKTKENGLRYVSWAAAWGKLLLLDPNATHEVKRYPDHQGNLVLPYLKTDVGYFVEVPVTVHGITRSELYPVMDQNYQPIFDPTATDINYSKQRALVKSIALHGLGLYMYAGEDLPFDFYNEEDNEEDLEPIENGELTTLQGDTMKDSHQPPVTSSQNVPIHTSTQTNKSPTYRLIDVQGGEGSEGPYYKAFWDKSDGEKVECIVHGDLMDVLEDLNTGDICTVTVREASNGFLFASTIVLVQRAEKRAS